MLERHEEQRDAAFACRHFAEFLQEEQVRAGVIPCCCLVLEGLAELVDDQQDGCGGRECLDCFEDGLGGSVTGPLCVGATEGLAGLRDCGRCPDGLGVVDCGLERAHDRSGDGFAAGSGDRPQHAFRGMLGHGRGESRSKVRVCVAYLLEGGGAP